MINIVIIRTDVYLLIAGTHMDEVEAYRALSSRSRLGIVKLLYKKPQSVEEIASHLKLQPISIRHHLQSLQEAGLIETYEERAGSVGRPRIYYRIVAAPPAIGFPKRRYLMLSSCIINAMQPMLGETKAEKVLKKAGLDMGETTARHLETEHEVKEWTAKAYEQSFVRGYLEEAGAEPEVVENNNEKVVYRLHNCIFFELSTKMPEIVCDVIREGFHEGLVKAMGKDVKVSQRSCLARGDAYCEYSCEWKNE